jgi:hypothetical protein
MSEALKLLSADMDERPLASAALAVAASMNMFIGGLEAYPDTEVSSVFTKAGTKMFKGAVYAIRAGVEYVCNDEKLGAEMLEEAERMRVETGKEVTELIVNAL